MVKAKKLELISELKELRKEKGMTYQDIVDATEVMGCRVSMSSVKSVFSDRQTHEHDYQHTLKPIADALMSPSEDDDLEIKVLQTRLEIKDEVVKQLEERIDKKEQRHKDREEFLMEQLQFYKEQIQFKDSQIKRLNEAIDRKDAMIRKYLIKEDK